MGIITAYAPHNSKPILERFEFFRSLDVEYRRCSANIAKFVFGDLNSRLGCQRPGEEHIIGEHTFGRAAVHEVEAPNRDMLLEACQSNGLLVANTFFRNPDAETVTFREAGYSYLGPVTPQGYNVLDLLLCDACSLDTVTSIRSHREAALGTDHYLVKAVLEFPADIQGTPDVRRNAEDVAALSVHAHRTAFTDAFCSMVHPPSCQQSTLSNWWEGGKEAMTFARKTLPPRQRIANKPWISEATLSLIDSRRIARANNDYEIEQRLHREVRKSAKVDRTVWLERILETGDWKQLRNIRKPKKLKHSRLRNASGDLIESDMWADTMAAHLEDIQWRVRPIGEVSGPLWEKFCL